MSVAGLVYSFAVFAREICMRREICTRICVCVHACHDAVRDKVMFSVEIISTFKAVKSHLKQTFYKQNLTLVVEGSFHKFHIK